MRKNRTMETKNNMVKKGLVKTNSDVIARRDNETHALGEKSRHVINTQNSLNAYKSNEDYTRYNKLQANNKETRRLQNNIRHIEKREEKQFEHKAIRFVTLLEMGHKNPDIYRGTGGLFVIREYIRYAQYETIMLIFKDNKAKLDILIDLLTYGYLDEETFWENKGVL